MSQPNAPGGTLALVYVLLAKQENWCEREITESLHSNFGLSDSMCEAVYWTSEEEGSKALLANFWMTPKAMDSGTRAKLMKQFEIGKGEEALLAHVNHNLILTFIWSFRKERIDQALWKAAKQAKVEDDKVSATLEEDPKMDVEDLVKQLEERKREIVRGNIREEMELILAGASAADARPEAAEGEGGEAG